MATIIQTPDVLNLLGNLKSFIVNSSSEVTFMLYHVGTTDALISETYYPDASGQVEIDIRDVIKPYLQIQTPNLSAGSWYNTPSTFVAEINQTSVKTFTVIPAGVRKMTDTAANFLKANWLTWQPQSKPVGYYSPEFLSYYAASSCFACARFYHLDGSATDRTFYEFESGWLATIRVSMDSLISDAGLSVDDLQGYIDVWVQDPDGVHLTYTQRYIFQPSEGNEHYYLCANSLGGIDTFTFHGALSLIPEVDHQVAEMSDVKVNITETAVRKWQQNTGYLNSLQGVWLWEFLSAESQWTISDGVLEKIILDTSDMAVKDNDNLHSCSFKFSLAEEGRLLNLSRTAQELPSLTEPSPGSLFF